MEAGLGEAGQTDIRFIMMMTSSHMRPLNATRKHDSHSKCVTFHDVLAQLYTP